MLRLTITLCLIVAAAAMPVAPKVPQLFGMTNLGRLETIDFRTAKATVYGNTSLAELGLVQSQGLAAIDPENNVAYSLVVNSTSQRYQVVGLDVEHGKVAFTSEPLPFELETFVGVGVFISFDPSSRDLLITGRTLAAQQEHQLARLCTKTGKVTNVARFGDMDIIGAASVYAPNVEKDIYMVANNVSGKPELQLQVVNARTKAVSKAAPDAHYMQSLSYDEKTGNVYGLGLSATNATSFVRTFLQLDPRTMDVKVISELPGYIVMSARVQALCHVGRKMFVLLQKGTTDADPAKVTAFDLLYGRPGQSHLIHTADTSMHLVTIDIDSGKILSSVKACETLADCPVAMFVAVR